MSLPSTEELSVALGLGEAEKELRSCPIGEQWPTLVGKSLTKLTRHGRFEKWWQTISRLPNEEPKKVVLNRKAPRVFGRQTISEDVWHELGPWKKGPFDVMGIVLDAEWRSDLKWDRVLAVASSLKGRRVLDVGTGNGYFLLRAAGEGARFTLGLEPSALYCAQYIALNRFYQRKDIALLPITSSEFPQSCRAFDTVLSMGVLYHRRSPLDHLAELKSFLRPGGQLILETIVVPGEEGYALVPEDRYAQMRNVWFLPTVPTLTSWLHRLGFEDLHISVPVPTTEVEQRSTRFSSQHSLRDFLDPEDKSRTVEGYPAPRRAVWVATAS